jgi:triosephosphate isomerase (TIM)
MNSKKILACNWKMNPQDLSQVENLIQNYNQLLKPNIDLVAFPPAIFINTFAVKSQIPFGLQEVSTEASGAFTGQISAAMAKSIGCNYALIGHSETREYLGVDNDLIVSKIRQSILVGVIPVLCVGHSKDKQNTDIDYAELTEQLNVFGSVFDDKSLNYPSEIIVAYEPVWAIGTGVIATNEIIFAVAEFIKNHLSQTLSFDSNFEIKVLYGGSVNAKNITILNQIENIDGYLVGGASLDVEQMKIMVGSL